MEILKADVAAVASEVVQNGLQVGDSDVWIAAEGGIGDIIDIRLKKLNVNLTERKVEPRFDVESRLSKRDFEIE